VSDVTEGLPVDTNVAPSDALSMNKRCPTLLLTLSLAVSPLACGDATPEEQACLDMAEAVAKAAERCGEDYQANYDAFIELGTGGSCSNITSVRDETALRQTCIPSLGTIECSALLAGTIDASCQAQLVRPQ